MCLLHRLLACLPLRALLRTNEGWAEANVFGIEFAGSRGAVSGGKASLDRAGIVDPSDQLINKVGGLQRVPICHEAEDVCTYRTASREHMQCM